MQISFSKYYIYISNVDCDKINMISWKKTQTTCDFVTKEAESHEDRKEKKKRKKEWQSEAGDSHRLSAGNQALCIIPTQQLSSDGAWCNRWICYCCASNSGGRNVPSGISTRFMSILAGRQEKNKYHGATAEKKKLKNRKTAEGKKSKTGKEIDPSMLKRK